MDGVRFDFFVCFSCFVCASFFVCFFVLDPPFPPLLLSADTSLLRQTFRVSVGGASGEVKILKGDAMMPFSSRWGRREL